MHHHLIGTLQALKAFMYQETTFEQIRAFTDPAVDQLLSTCEIRLERIERLAGLRHNHDDIWYSVDYAPREESASPSYY